MEQKNFNASVNQKIDQAIKHAQHVRCLIRTMQRELLSNQSREKESRSTEHSRNFKSIKDNCKKLFVFCMLVAIGVVFMPMLLLC